jgi:hypothetical protein
MVAEHGIGAAFDRGVRERTLVVGQDRLAARLPLVQADDDKVRGAVACDRASASNQSRNTFTFGRRKARAGQTT